MKSSKMKKVLFTMLTAVAVFMLFAVTAYAESYGNFSYTPVSPEEGEDFEDYIEITGYSLNDEELGSVISIPADIEDVPVTTIAASAFANKELLGEVIIPEGVKTIENAAFKNCKDLKIVVIPDSVEYIGESAFQGCESLEYVIIGKGVKVIGDISFKDCKALKAVSLSEGVEVVGAGAFFGCPELKIVNIPSSVKDIESLAFGFVQNGNVESVVEGFTFVSNDVAAVSSYNERYSLTDTEDVTGVSVISAFSVVADENCDNEKFVNVRKATDSYEGLDLAFCEKCGKITTKANTDIEDVDVGSSSLISFIVIAVFVVAFIILVLWYVKKSKKNREASILAYKEGRPMPDAEQKAKEEAKAQEKYAKKRAKQEAKLKKYIDLK